jgi:predicted dehydrogenase
MLRSSEPLSARWDNPRATSAKHEGHVALIGCGNFAFTTLAYYCTRALPGSIRACFDTDGARALSLGQRYGALYAASEVSQILADPAISLVFVASNHASHADYAIAALEAGKSVHIEKPHVVSFDQLERLLQAARRSQAGRVYLGFNRPRSAHFRVVSEWLGAEQGPIMLNWFVAGHQISDEHWYFSPSEGGRVLGNLCHWTDLTLRLVPHVAGGEILVTSGGRPDATSDFVVNFSFPDGSLASITFSAKGHTFEGVREVLHAHRGDALVTLRDFAESRLDRGYARRRFTTYYRDHGHEENVLNSLYGRQAVDSAYLERTARLFLRAREAIESAAPTRA